MISFGHVWIFIGSDRSQEISFFIIFSGFSESVNSFCPIAFTAKYSWVTTSQDSAISNLGSVTVSISSSFSHSIFLYTSYLLASGSFIQVSTDFVLSVTILRSFIHRSTGALKSFGLSQHFQSNTSPEKSHREHLSFFFNRGSWAASSSVDWE